MAITFERKGGRTGSFTTLDNSTQVLRWLATADNRYETADTVKTAGILSGNLPIPQVTKLDGNPPMLCRGVDAKQDEDSPKHWILEAKYSSAPIDQAKQEREEVPDPTDRRARIKFNAVERQRYVTKDLDGKPFVNSAGDAYPPQALDCPNWIISIEKDVLAIPAGFDTFLRSKNSNAFTVRGFEVLVGTARFYNPEISDRKKEGDVEFFTLSYQIEVQTEGWDLSLLDEGYRIIDIVGTETSGELVNAKDAQGDNVTAPILLDGAGAVLLNPSADNAHYNDFVVLTAKDYSDLPGIGDS